MCAQSEKMEMKKLWLAKSRVRQLQPQQLIEVFSVQEAKELDDPVT